MPTNIDHQVQQQYEDFPYPQRDPADERKRLITGSPSLLVELTHYVFNGIRPKDRPLKILVAGGGTGDAAIMLAQQLADDQKAGGPGGWVEYLDMSKASRAVCEARALVRQLQNIRFHTGSLLDLSAVGLSDQRFDYIDCCGVLHHLDDPTAGLKSLGSVLSDDGGMGLMVYGKYGRTGLYPLQQALATLGQGLSNPEKVIQAKKLLHELPASNWFKLNPHLGDHLLGDAGIFDLLLHARDRAYDVMEWAQTLDQAGLKPVSWLLPARYNPLTFLMDPALRDTAKALPELQQKALAEILSGAIKTHITYVVKQERPTTAVAQLDRPSRIPTPASLDEWVGMARALPRSPHVKIELERTSVRRTFTGPEVLLLQATDGRHNLQQLFDIARSREASLDWLAFHRRYSALFEFFNAVGKLFLQG